jgi:hypothetical protein
MEKVAENGRKVKAIALRFCVCLFLYEKWKKVCENGRKVKVIALVFAVLCPFMKNGKSRLKWTKSNGYSLTFLPFFAP